MPRRQHSPKALKRYWIAYCRKSTDAEDKQVHSLEDQEKLNREYYASLSEEEKRFPLLLIQESKSAFRPNKRPEFEKMMQMAKNGEVFGVVAVQVNRISRNPEDSGLFTQLLVSDVVQCLDVSVERRRYTGKDSNAIFMLTLEGIMSWKDSKDKGSNIRQRMKERAGEGKTMGRKSFGFKSHKYFTPEGAEVRDTVPDEPRLSHAVAMFRMAATGTYSLSQLEKWAETKKVRMRPKKKNLTGKLSTTAIAHILHDPYYKGWTRFHGELTKQWLKAGEEPPVSEELWNRVQLVLLNRCTNTSRVKEDSLRRLFMYGSVIQCGKCEGCLSPYKVAKKSGKLYVYYECKNRKTKCKVSLEQQVVLKHYTEKIEKVHLEKMELEDVRTSLLQLHKQKTQQGNSQRDQIHAEYKQVVQAISDQLSTMKIAEDMGVGEIAKENMQKLIDQRNALQLTLNQAHQEGSEWIEKVVRSFELLKMAEEMLKHGSPHVREAILKAICSNYSVVDEKLVLELRSPFKEAATKADNPLWWTILGSNQ